MPAFAARRSPLVSPSLCLTSPRTLIGTITNDDLESQSQSSACVLCLQGSLESQLTHTIVTVTVRVTAMAGRRLHAHTTPPFMRPMHGQHAVILVQTAHALHHLHSRDAPLSLVMALALPTYF